MEVCVDDPLNVVSLTSIHMPTDALPGIKGALIDVSKDEKFSTRLPLLGYINEGRNAYTVRRLPVRRNKAGLHAENLRIDNVNGVGGGINYASRSVADMLMNKYPKFSDALSLYTTKRISPVLSARQCISVALANLISVCSFWAVLSVCIHHLTMPSD